MFAPLWCSWEVVEHLEDGLSGRKLVHREHVLERETGTLVPPLSLFLLPGFLGVRHILRHMDVLLPGYTALHGPKATESTDHELNLLKL